jgi:hypothetical protein
MVSRIIARTVVGAFLITICMFTWVVLGTLATQSELEQRELRSQYPKIEQCDLPLWDRIRHKCPD